jgi:AraC family transcriptional regulator of adaptative response / DNA-3-methyladenine glycosylase II
MSENRQLLGTVSANMDGVMDDDQRYRAVHSRDARFDGVFYTAVRTTGIYCRPSCPAVTPKRVNVRFFPTAAAAQESGFRACKRCRPDLTPGSPEWNLRADVVGRAMRLIQDGAVDRGGVSALASAVGYSERQLNRLLSAEVGAGPLALARTERAQTARVLVETTDMPMADVAFAAGFASVRQFNETMRAVFDRSPTQMRTTGSGRASASGGSRPPVTEPGTVTLRLPYREPIDLARILGFLGDRAVPGVEEYRDGVYRRTLMLARGPAVVELSEGSGTGGSRRVGAAGGGRSAGGGGHVLCRLRLSEVRDLTSAVRRCRRLLDLDADPGRWPRPWALTRSWDRWWPPVRDCAPPGTWTRLSWRSVRCSASRCRCVRPVRWRDAWWNGSAHRSLRAWRCRAEGSPTCFPLLTCSPPPTLPVSPFRSHGGAPWRG